MDWGDFCGLWILHDRNQLRLAHLCALNVVRLLLWVVEGVNSEVDREGNVSSETTATANASNQLNRPVLLAELYFYLIHLV